ncbi:MAG: hypothetical protein H6620_07255 [Halobacteriovoraceae bacterium]|nr:hypothetical protein [Halobacteriovoraceae bacterium]
MLKVYHLNNNQTPEFDDYFHQKFKKRILQHLNIKGKEVLANLSINSSGLENFLTLHYHYQKEHYHLHAHGTNIYKSAKKLIEELEKVILKHRKKIRKIKTTKQGEVNENTWNLNWN